MCSDANETAALRSAAMDRALQQHPSIKGLAHALRKISEAGQDVTISDIKTYARLALQKWERTT